MYKVQLVNLSGANQIIIPYSCGALEAYVAQDETIRSRYQFLPYLFHIEKDVESTVESLLESEGDIKILGLSLYSWNKNRSLKLAKLVKSRNPGVLVLVGGPEIPDDSGSFFETHPYVDIAAHKEGEETFRLILKEALEEAPSWEQIAGISYIKNGEFFHQPPAKRNAGLLAYPSPWLGGYFNSCIEYLDRKGLPRIGIWESNRGCPYSCTFCDWGSATNSKLQTLERERLFQEIEYMGREIDEIHLGDANFGILPRDLELAQKIVEEVDRPGSRLRSMHMNYAKVPSEITYSIAKLFESRMLTRSGVTLSVQTFTPEVLSNIKRVNLSSERFEEVTARFRQDGIQFYTELILGLPGETEESFFKSVERALQSEVLDLRIYQLGIYPNAEMNTPATRAKFALKTEPWVIVKGERSDEDEHLETVIETNTLSAEQMRSIKKFAEALEVLHFGKWLYYISTFLKRERAINYTDFYRRLFRFAEQHRNGVVWGLYDFEFLMKFNSGDFNEFVGPHSPFNVTWKRGVSTFRRTTFNWLCVAEQRGKFYREVEAFLNTVLEDAELIKDLINFQDEMIFNINYDPAVGKKVLTRYNWYSYFRDKVPLSPKPETLLFRDKFVGRYKVELRPHDPQVYFVAAGGYAVNFQKMNSFAHQDVQIESARQREESKIIAP